MERSPHRSRRLGPRQSDPPAPVKSRPLAHLYSKLLQNSVAFISFCLAETLRVQGIGLTDTEPFETPPSSKSSHFLGHHRMNHGLMHQVLDL